MEVYQLLKATSGLAGSAPESPWPDPLTPCGFSFPSYKLWSYMQPLLTARLLYARHCAMHFLCMFSFGLPATLEMGTLPSPFYRRRSWGSEVPSLVSETVSFYITHNAPLHCCCDLKGRLLWHTEKKWLRIKRNEWQRAKNAKYLW